MLDHNSASQPVKRGFIDQTIERENVTLISNRKVGHLAEIKTFAKTRIEDTVLITNIKPIPVDN